MKPEHTENEPRLDAPAQVGGTRFGAGIKWSTVIAAAQRHHAYMNTPEREAERIKKAGKNMRKLRSAIAAQPVEVRQLMPMPDAAHELHACRDMLEDARSDLHAIREALGVPYEPHQTLRCRLLEAARAKAGRGFIREVPLEISEAIDRLRQAIHSDPEYAWSWHCNVAMAAYDEGLDRPAANRAAARFMMQAFGINMRKHPYFAETQREPKRK